MSGTNVPLYMIPPDQRAKVQAADAAGSNRGSQVGAPQSAGSAAPPHSHAGYQPNHNQQQQPYHYPPQHQGYYNHPPQQQQQQYAHYAPVGGYTPPNQGQYPAYQQQHPPSYGNPHSSGPYYGAYPQQAPPQNYQHPNPNPPPQSSQSAESGLSRRPQQANPNRYTTGNPYGEQSAGRTGAPQHNTAPEKPISPSVQTQTQPPKIEDPVVEQQHSVVSFGVPGGGVGVHGPPSVQSGGNDRAGTSSGMPSDQQMQHQPSVVAFGVPGGIQDPEQKKAHLEILQKNPEAFGRLSALPGLGKTSANLMGLRNDGDFPVFGVPLELVMRYQGKGYIPFVVEKCIRFLWPHVGKEGLFRVAGLKSKMDELIREFDENEDPDLSKEDVHVVAGVLKYYFRSLPVPIMTYDLYPEFLLVAEIADEEKRIKELRKLCDKLPECNHALLESFFLFLEHIVKDEKNLMTAKNIAIVFAPSFLKAEKETPQSFMKDQEAVHTIMTDILQNPADMFGILHLKDFGEKFKVNEEIGCGAFAVVSKCTDIDTGEQFAVKMIQKSTLLEKDVERLVSEISILKKVRHPGVIALRAVCESQDHVYLVMELATGGELFDQIVNVGVHSEKDATGILRQLLNALEYLHSMGIVHRDIKPENILLKEPNSQIIKLADFGLSKMFDATVRMNSTVGSPGYVAPEVLFDDNYGEPVDMWSVGVITYILLSGVPPFYDKNIKDLFKKIMTADYEFPSDKWDAVSDSAKDFIKKLLVADPQNRMTATQALSHHWLADSHNASIKQLKVDIDMLKRKKQEKEQKAQAQREFAKATSSVVITGVEHNFSKKTFYSPVWCRHCAAFLWGLRNQGYSCKNCDAVVHDKCKNKVGKTCLQEKKK